MPITTHESVAQELEFEPAPTAPHRPTPTEAGTSATEALLSDLKKSIRTIVESAVNTTGHGLTDDEIYADYRRRGYPPRSPQRVRTARAEITETRYMVSPILTAEPSQGTSELGNAATIWTLA
jgi:hypothetical protein